MDLSYDATQTMWPRANFSKMGKSSSSWFLRKTWPSLTPFREFVQLSTLASRLERMVVSPSEYKALSGNACVERPLQKQLQMQAQNIALFRHKNNGGGLVCLHLRLNFALLACLSFSVCQTIGAFIAAVFGSFLFGAHDTVSDGKLSERANPWLSSSGKTFRV